jgi:osmoprotectant transport system permease protein
VSLGGLGVFIREGQQTSQYYQMASGAVLVAILAVVCDLILAGVQRLVVSRGLTGRYAKGALAGRIGGPEEVGEDVDLERIAAPG